MRCCVPCCENKSENVSRNNEITFLKVPGDAHVRAAWLSALGLQNAPLPDSALVCSQHFLRDDSRGTAAADSSPVQVCITCLDTDGKMFLMNKHKLDDAYEKLTGFPPCDGENLTQALCVQCAHRLRHFSRFRDMSLRARSLMMELVKQHELITKSHIKTLNSTTNELKNNLVSTKLGPDHCDLHIVHCDEDTQPTLEERSVVKKECRDDSIMVEIEADATSEKYSKANHVNIEVTLEPLKYESAPYICTVCYEKFHNEHAYGAHVRRHGDVTADSAPMMITSIKTEIDEHATDEAGNFASTQDVGVFDATPLPASLEIKTENEQYPTEEVDKNPKISAPWHTVSCYDSSRAHTAGVAVASLPATGPRTQTFTCDVCLRVFYKRRKFVYHIRTHTTQKPYSCPRKLCGYRCTQSGSFVTHMMTHTGEKPYTCEVCDYKCVNKSTIVKHVKTHDDVKPYSCTLCKYKSKRNYDLARHMKIHTGEKPFSCDMCPYKSSEKIKLIYHIRTHTGEKPYSCTMCDYKCTQSASLVKHVRTHRKKPFSCKFCDYTCAKRGSLARHMKVHIH